MGRAFWRAARYATALWNGDSVSYRAGAASTAHDQPPKRVPDGHDQPPKRDRVPDGHDLPAKCDGVRDCPRSACQTRRGS